MRRLLAWLVTLLFLAVTAIVIRDTLRADRIVWPVLWLPILLGLMAGWAWVQIGRDRRH